MKQANKSFLQIWKQMDHARRIQAAEAFNADADNTAERRRAAGVVAAKLNLRPQKAAKLPPERIASYLASIDALDEQLAANLIRSYLFGKQLSMLTMFLDQLHIPHKDGAIGDETVPPPDTESLRTALAQIRGAFDAIDVQIYLSALLISDTQTWANLQAAVQADVASPESPATQP